MSRIVDIEPLLKKYDGMNEGTEFSPIHFINDLMALEQQPCEEDFIQHKKEVLERIARREREIDKYIKELEELEQQPFINKPCVSEGVCREDKIQVLEKIRAEIKAKIEEKEFARSVFRHEEKDTYKAEQCTGSIMAYNNVIKLINKYKAESEDAE